LDRKSEESLERKARSEIVLSRDGLPINPHLPVIEIELEVHLRSKNEVAYRALALLVAALKGEGLEEPIVEKLVKQYELTPRFTFKETAFVRNAAPSQTKCVQFSWRYEAAWVLLWVLSYVEELERPSKICDVQRAVGIMKEHSTAQFITDAKLRSLSQVLDEADLIYRYHWAVVDARIKNKPSPAGLEPGVVQERHHALNWLIGYMDQDWDEVSTDT
jgi:hypothetical protein